MYGTYWHNYTITDPAIICSTITGGKMRRGLRELKDEAVQTLARLIARHEDRISDEDYDLLTLAMDSKVNTRTMERVIDKITDSSRDDMMDVLADSSDSKDLFIDTIKEAFDIMKDRRRSSDRYSSDRRGSTSRRRAYEEDSSDLGTIIDVLDKYMRANNIPFPSTETAFITMMDRLKGKSNEPDIIAYTGSAKKLYKEMLNARRR